MSGNMMDHVCSTIDQPSKNSLVPSSHSQVFMLHVGNGPGDEAI